MSGDFTERTRRRVPDNIKDDTALEGGETCGLGRPGPWEHG